MSERWPREDADLDDEEDEEEAEVELDLEPRDDLAEHAGGELEIPDDVVVLEGAPSGARRSVAVVAARFNGGVTTALLESALDELDRAGAAQAR